jgi:hypothetical protein
LLAGVLMVAAATTSPAKEDSLAWSLDAVDTEARIVAPPEPGQPAVFQDHDGAKWKFVCLDPKNPSVVEPLVSSEEFKNFFLAQNGTRFSASLNVSNPPHQKEVFIGARDFDVAVAFVAPKDGVYRVSGKAYLCNESQESPTISLTVSTFAGGDVTQLSQGDYKISTLDADFGAIPALQKIRLRAGDELLFIVGRDLSGNTEGKNDSRWVIRDDRADGVSAITENPLTVTLLP